MARRTDTEIFLDALREAGRRASNTYLRDRLGWRQERYWRVHAQLLVDGRIGRARGDRGLVALAGAAARPAASDGLHGVYAPGPGRSPAARELDLYEPVKQQIEAHWAQTRQLDHCHCEITALQGRRETGGSWSRPDLVLIGYKKYEFLPQKAFELVSFEVKPATDVSVKGVFETLSHREAATRSFVIYNTAGREFSAFAEAGRIEDLATKHGIGIFAAKSVSRFDQWTEIVPAPRTTPDPEAVDTFIRRTLSDAGKTKLRKWF